MNPDLARAAALAAATAVRASVTVPDADWQSYDRPLLVDVTSDMTLTAALAGRSLSSCGTIVKTGPAVLTVDGDEIASFAGEIHVWEGCWKVTASGHLGTAAGGTFVHGQTNKDYPQENDGNGYLWFANTKASQASFEGEVITVSGSGRYCDYRGWGAIYAFSAQANDSWGDACPFRWGSVWKLSADATVCVQGGEPRLNVADIRLEGHRLTLMGRIDRHLGDGPMADRIGNVEGFGGLCLRSALSLSGLLGGWSAAPGGHLALDGSSLTYKDLKPVASVPLVVTNRSVFLTQSYMGGDLDPRRFQKFQNVCSNPIDLGATLQVRPIVDAGSSLTITNVVTGLGGFLVGDGERRNFTFHLDNAANAFRGGIDVCGPAMTVSLGADGSLPADGGALALTNAAVAFARADVAYRLPDLVLAGTSAVETVTADPASAWRHVRKVTADAATWASAVGAASLAVEEGALDVRTLYDRARFAGLTCYFATNVPAGTSFADFKARATNAVAQCKTTRDYLSYNIGGRPEVPDGGAVGYEGWIWWEGNDGDAWTFVAASGPGLVYCAVNGDVLYDCDNRTMNNRVLNAFADLDARTVTVRRGWNRFEAFTRKGWGGMASATTGAFSWPGSKSLTVCFAGGESTDPNAYALVCDRSEDAENGKDLVSATGDATLDGRDWMPRFGDVQVAAGATLNLGAALSCASLGGSGAVCGDVAAERVRVEARGFAGPLAVDGDVTLSQGLVELVGGEALRTAESLPVLTATGAIRGAEGLTVVSDGRHAFSARVSADGKSILLTCHRQGLMLLVR